jgi:hypothetical protein
MITFSIQKDEIHWTWSMEEPLMHMKITRPPDLGNRRILKWVLGSNVALAQGHSSMATSCERHDVRLILYPLVVRLWIIGMREINEPCVYSSRELWYLAQCTAYEIWFMKSVTLYFSTAAAVMLVCYCDFKSHLIMFMQTGCSIGADTLWITVLQKTVSCLFRILSLGLATDRQK